MNDSNTEAVTKDERAVFIDWLNRDFRGATPSAVVVEWMFDAYRAGNKRAALTSDVAQAPVALTEAQIESIATDARQHKASEFLDSCKVASHENVVWAIRRALRAAPVAPTPETVDVGPNLEGLREKLLAQREIVRTSDGWLYHPDYPTCDEGTRADKFLEAFGIETRFVGAESDSPDFAERWIEEGLTNCSEWTPTTPEGDGWLLLEIYDTEDGPYALFGRDWYAAEQARKMAHTRRLREEWRRRRIAALAATAPSDAEKKS